MWNRKKKKELDHEDWMRSAMLVLLSNTADIASPEQRSRGREIYDNLTKIHTGLDVEVPVTEMPLNPSERYPALTRFLKGR